jgi:3-oxoacyl-[acyl-carrier-protein] synthase III
MGVVMSGLGSHLPGPRIGHSVIEAATGFPAAQKGCSLDEWSDAHHGARLRHHFGAETTAGMALAAANQALAGAGVGGGDLDLLVFSTITGDHVLPGVASETQARLGARGAKTFELASACTGFVDGLEMAAALLRAGRYRRGLVIAADRLTATLSPTDWLAWSVFGDGAAAAVVEQRPDSDSEGAGFVAFASGTAGHCGDFVREGWRDPADPASVPAAMEVDFRSVSAWAVDHLVHGTLEVLAAAGADLADVALFVPHQASRAIIENYRLKLSIDDERMVSCFAEFGNSGGSSLGIALKRSVDAGLVSSGDLIVLPSVGAGMAWGAALYRWE